MRATFSSRQAARNEGRLLAWRWHTRWVVPRSEQQIDTPDSWAGASLEAGGIHRQKALQIGGLRSSAVISAHPQKALFRIASEHSELALETCQKVAMPCKRLNHAITEARGSVVSRLSFWFPARWRRMAFFENSLDFEGCSRVYYYSFR